MGSATPEQPDPRRQDAGEMAETERTPERPRRGRRSPGTGSEEGALDLGQAGESAEQSDLDPGSFPDTEHLTRKGLRIVPVVTGAVVDAGGNFLFYVDGHEDARSAVQAQINHLLGSGPARGEHLARARARADYLSDKLARPR